MLSELSVSVHTILSCSGKKTLAADYIEEDATSNTK